MDQPSSSSKIRSLVSGNKVLNEGLALKAVQEDGNEIEYIDNPSEAVKLAAVKQQPWAIRHIYNRSEAVCLAAVNQNCHVIQLIDNPSEAVCIAAVQQNSWTIKHIKNPSEAVCLAAVEQNVEVIARIKTPPIKVQVQVVKSAPWAIIHLIQRIADDADTSRPGRLFGLPVKFTEDKKWVHDRIAAIHLLYYPRFLKTPKNILDRAPEILESHCPGLADVYTIGLSIGMNGEDLSKTMIEWTENQQEAFHP